MNKLWKDEEEADLMWNLQHGAPLQVPSIFDSPIKATFNPLLPFEPVSHYGPYNSDYGRKDYEKMWSEASQNLSDALTKCKKLEDELARLKASPPLAGVILDTEAVYIKHILIEHEFLRAMMEYARRTKELNLEPFVWPLEDDEDDSNNSNSQEEEEKVLIVQHFVTYLLMVYGYKLQKDRVEYLLCALFHKAERAHDAPLCVPFRGKISSQSMRRSYFFIVPAEYWARCETVYLELLAEKPDMQPKLAVVKKISKQRGSGNSFPFNTPVTQNFDQTRGVAYRLYKQFSYYNEKHVDAGHPRYKDTGLLHCQLMSREEVEIVKKGNWVEVRDVVKNAPRECLTACVYTFNGKIIYEPKMKQPSLIPTLVLLNKNEDDDDNDDAEEEDDDEEVQQKKKKKRTS